MERADLLKVNMIITEKTEQLTNIVNHFDMCQREVIVEGIWEAEGKKHNSRY